MGGTLALFCQFAKNMAADRRDLLLYTVHREKMRPAIVQRGTLESAENDDIICHVKARTPGSIIASTVRWVVDAGTEVKRGDKLVELDDSGLEEQLKNQQTTVDTAEAAWIEAEQACKIGQSQNDSDIASAALKIELARMALRNYLEGEYPKTKRDIEGRLLMARSDLEMWENRAAWSYRMSRPDRRYVSQSQAEADQARKVSAQISLTSVEEERRILEDPNSGTKAQNIKKLQGDIDEASRALERTREQAKAKAVQFEADREAKQFAYQHAVKIYQDIEAEIQKCTIYAPHDGLVVFYVPEQSRSRIGSQQAIVAQGEPVREGQKLMSIPDLSKMLVKTRVPEAQISLVHGEVWHRTGFTQAVQVGLWATPDLWGRLSAQTFYAREWPNFAEAHKSADQRLIDGGQAALVRIDAFPEKVLKGHVKSVSMLASQQEWLLADRKLYQTFVTIDEPLEGLRPDMSAEVTILTDEGRDDVLAVPLLAVVGPSGKESPRCVVLTPEGPVERPVTLGLSDATRVEVASGLEEGEQVLLSPGVAALAP
jgi:multidrug resistance efflux pump